MIAFSVGGVTDPSSADQATGFTYAFDCGSGYGGFGASASTNCPAGDGPGTVTIAAKARDKDGGVSDAVSSTFTVKNVPPTATFTAPASVNEGSPIGLSLTSANDVSQADVEEGFTYAFDCGSGYGSFGAASTASCPTTDNGTRTVKGKIQDKDGGFTEYTKIVTIDNVAPVITLPLTLPTSPTPASSPVTMTWNFTDPGNDTWQCKISWDLPANPGDPIVFEGSFASSGKSCSTSKSLTPGIYTVTVHVQDDDGGSDQETATAYIVVYDPSAGFVTGGGWINSPAGAYVDTPSLTGKANFGFVSKYKKGMTVPEGNTEFQFHAGNMNFKSSSYDWLVVATFKAQFKGVGTINGVGGYYFMLSAIDGQINGGGGSDKFRMKIWKLVNNAEVVVYDNQINAAIDADPTTTLGGGSIVIHSK
jgi:hypothetical protein